MKKIKPIIALLLITCILSSCATVFGGSVNSYQRTKPVPGQQQRKIRAGAMIADIILFPLGLVVDFATCAIYKPFPTNVPETPAPVSGTNN
jgi:hypothetical protein